MSVFSKAYQKTTSLKSESHILLGMCLTVMIPATYTRCLSCGPRAPGSISEFSISWYLKYKDFGTGDNFLGIEILNVGWFQPLNFGVFSHKTKFTRLDMNIITQPLVVQYSLCIVSDQHWHVPFATSQIKILCKHQCLLPSCFKKATPSIYLFCFPIKKKNLYST